MIIETDVYNEVRNLQLTEDREEILDRAVALFRQFGAHAVIITGLPMPNGLLDPLILRAWSLTMARDRSALSQVPSTDPLLKKCLIARESFFWPENEEGNRPTSDLVQVLRQAGTGTTILVITGIAPEQFQGVVFLVGSKLPKDCRDLRCLEFFTGEMFKHLDQVGALSKQRQGDLSSRERRVLELTACGKTAADIAAMLSISQRTVHAHLQNASNKLNASNKTQTVVEAIRYGQIGL